MTDQKVFKTRVRERMAKTGEAYTAARKKLLDAPEAFPKGWQASGKAPQDYEFSTDRSQFHSGSRSARIRARMDKPSDFGTLAQKIAAGPYLGRRLRFRAWVKTADVRGQSRLWLRVDRGQEMLVLSNMEANPIAGTTPWTEYHQVVDVAPDATSVLFGLILNGSGTAWLDDVALEVVSNDVPTTGFFLMHEHPVNLSFEE